MIEVKKIQGWTSAKTWIANESNSLGGEVWGIGSKKIWEIYSPEQPHDRQRENNVAVIVVFTMGHDEIFREKDIENGGREVEHMNTDGGWTGSISDTVVIYHNSRVFHPLAMLSTSQKDTPFSCLAMVGLNSLLVRAVARTYNSPWWTRHAFFTLISNGLSRRCTVYTSLIITRVRFHPNYHHRLSNFASHEEKRRENLVFL